MSVQHTAIRNTARLIVRDEQGRVAMLRINPLPDAGVPAERLKPFLITPGGRIEEGETAVQAAKRELFEELGIDSEVLGPYWYGEQVLKIRGVDTLFRENFFYVKVNSTEIKLDCSNQTEEERSVLDDCRWWSIKELRETSDEYFPAKLVEYLEMEVGEEIKKVEL
jgi:8-oxo-dGTP pyrophosphatase MutT (NUDIX family)